MLWWERLLEIAAGLLTVGVPATIGAMHKLKPPAFNNNAPAMVSNSMVYMQDMHGRWWQMQPANMKLQNLRQS
jgi:hypothetical protein